MRCVICSQKRLFEKKYYPKSTRSTKTRKFYTVGDGADGKWVEEAAIASTSILEGGYGYRELEWKSILHKEVDKDSDAMMPR
jgi:hypothetical protein